VSVSDLGSVSLRRVVTDIHSAQRMPVWQVSAGRIGIQDSRMRRRADRKRYIIRRKDLADHTGGSTSTRSFRSSATVSGSGRSQSFNATADGRTSIGNWERHDASSHAIGCPHRPQQSWGSAYGKLQCGQSVMNTSEERSTRSGGERNSGWRYYNTTEKRTTTTNRNRIS